VKIKFEYLGESEVIDENAFGCGVKQGPRKKCLMKKREINIS
jgi:hypothetical protein